VKEDDRRRNERREAYPLGAAARVDELEHDPYPLFARLREREPVTWFDALDAWVVTSRDHALLVARNPADFTVEHPRMSVRALLSSNMLTVDGSAHAYHRGPFSRPFRLAEVRTAFASYLSDEVAALAGSFVAAGEAELRSQLAGPLACKTIAAVLGLPTLDIQVLHGWYDAFADAMTQFATFGALPPEGPGTYAAFRALVEQHLNDGGLDRSLLERVQTTEGGGLAADDLISNAALLMFGGIETTESMILNAVWLLLNNPDQLRRLKRNGDLLDNAIEESLRLEAAVASFERFATRRTELGDAEIDAGDAVVIMAGAANRDPGFYPDPDTFDITRPNAKHHLAFAAGPHVCLGMHLARLEARTAVSGLLQAIPGIALDRARSEPPQGIVFRKPPHLTVTWNSSA
jgi:cytochrome P450